MSFSFLSAMPDPTTIIFIVLLVVLIVALLVVPMFTNKKRAKQTEELHRSLRPGDVIKTVGGIIGTIKEIRQVSQYDKEMVVETGSGDNKTTMTFDIQALYQVISRGDAPVESVEEPAPEVAEKEQPEEDVAPAPAEPVAEKAAEEPAVEEPVAAPVDTSDEQAAVKAEEPAPEVAPAEGSSPKTASKPAAKKTSSTTKKPAAKKPIAKNK